MVYPPQHPALPSSPRARAIQERSRLRPVDQHQQPRLPGHDVPAAGHAVYDRAADGTLLPPIAAELPVGIDFLGLPSASPSCSGSARPTKAPRIIASRRLTFRGGGESKVVKVKPASRVRCRAAASSARGAEDREELRALANPGESARARGGHCALVWFEARGSSGRERRAVV